MQCSAMQQTMTPKKCVQVNYISIYIKDMFCAADMTAFFI